MYHVYGDNHLKNWRIWKNFQIRLNSPVSCRLKELQLLENLPKVVKLTCSKELCILEDFLFYTKLLSDLEKLPKSIKLSALYQDEIAEAVNMKLMTVNDRIKVLTEMEKFPKPYKLSALYQNGSSLSSLSCIILNTGLMEHPNSFLIWLADLPSLCNLMI